MAQARGAPGLNRFGRLGAALAIPAAGVAALLVAVAVQHRATPPRTPVNVVVTPTPLPTPTDFPDVLSEFDVFTIEPPQAFGSLAQALPRSSPPPGITVTLTLQAPPQGALPQKLPVWRFTPEPIDARAVANRFGISQNDTGLVEGGVVNFHAGLSVDPATTTITWSANGVASPQLGGKPRDASSAEQLATRWLLRAGLAPFAGAAATVEQTSNGESASFPEWTITWPRVAPLPMPTPAIDQVVARVSADGTLKQLDFVHPRITTGSPYPLRPWQDAFRDAQAGRWYQPCCQPFPELVPPGSLHITIRSVSLVYQTVRLSTGMYAIPMYAFGEGPGYEPGLVPALAP